MDKTYQIISCSNAQNIFHLDSSNLHNNAIKTLARSFSFVPHALQYHTFESSISSFMCSINLILAHRKKTLDRYRSMLLFSRKTVRTQGHVYETQETTNNYKNNNPKQHK